MHTAHATCHMPHATCTCTYPLSSAHAYWSDLSSLRLTPTWMDVGGGRVRTPPGGAHVAIHAVPLHLSRLQTPDSRLQTPDSRLQSHSPDPGHRDDSHARVGRSHLAQLARGVPAVAQLAIGGARREHLRMCMCMCSMKAPVWMKPSRAHAHAHAPVESTSFAVNPTARSSSQLKPHVLKSSLTGKSLQNSDKG